MNSELTELIERVFGEDYLYVVKLGDFQESDLWDSLIYVNLVVSIEKTYKIELSQKEIQSLTSVANIEAILNKRGISAIG